MRDVVWRTNDPSSEVRTFWESEYPEMATVKERLDETPSHDIFVFIVKEDEELLGADIFTRLTFDQDLRVASVLAPMAVPTTREDQGIGKKLLMSGLKTLDKQGVEIAMTYGDPNCYGTVGLQPIREKDAAVPFKLQMPEGWLAQSFTEARVIPLKGGAHCVPALDDPMYW